MPCRGSLAPTFLSLLCHEGVLSSPICRSKAGMAVNAGCFAVRGGQNSSPNQQPRSAPTPRPTRCHVGGPLAPTFLPLLCHEGVLSSSICKSRSGMAANAGCFAVRGGQNSSPNQQPRSAPIQVGVRLRKPLLLFNHIGFDVNQASRLFKTHHIWCCDGRWGGCLLAIDVLGGM